MAPEVPHPRETGIAVTLPLPDEETGSDWGIDQTEAKWLSQGWKLGPWASAPDGWGRQGGQRHPDQSNFEEAHTCALLDESSESSGLGQGW